MIPLANLIKLNDLDEGPFDIQMQTEINKYLLNFIKEWYNNVDLSVMIADCFGRGVRNDE